MNGNKAFALLVAIATATTPVAAFAQNYDHGNNDGGIRSDQGVIASVNGTDIRLEDGRDIFLHHGTVINPRGINLARGQRISVVGDRARDGAINASEIDVTGNGDRERRHRHNDDNRGER